MSIYPQQQAYTQPPFPHAYPPQPPSYALPSPPIYPIDPTSFRSDYTARLAGLTDNSRLIIQGLSMYAHDFSRWGDVVTQCIEAHIRRVSGCYRFAVLLVQDYIHSSGGLEDGVAISSNNCFVACALVFV
jgi:pre-mRNA cleavage complex 2 protein Pcf11